MVAYFPNYKIPTRPNFVQNRNVKRDAVFIDDQYLCPLCMTSDYTVIKTELEKDKKHSLLHTGRCKKCGIQIRYNKPIPEVK